SGPRRRLDENGASSRLRRPSVLLARVLRVQDGLAVRLLDLLARRRRQGAALPAMVQHSESPTTGAYCNARARPGGSAEGNSSKALEWIFRESVEHARGRAAKRA